MLLSSKRQTALLYRRSRRLRVFFICAILSTLTLVSWLNISFNDLIEILPPSISGRPAYFRIPPLYKPYYEQEKILPQHNASLPFPEGDNGRYLWVSNQVWGLGWNNVFQTYYMLALMAYLSNRSFVFHPYTWDLGRAPFVTYYGKKLPSRIPLTVILSGPMGGGPIPSEVSPAPPRAVNEEYFRTVCPKKRIKVVRLEDISKDTDDLDAQAIMDRFVKVLRDDVKDGCVELRRKEHAFDWKLLGTPRILSIWPALSQSPIMTHFSWSQIVLSALQSNAHILTSLPPFPTPHTSHHALSPFHPTLLPSIDLASRTPFPNLLAIHIRRGDYQTHCHLLANWSSSYMGWSQHPGLPASDVFVPPPGGSAGDNTPENREVYMKHCLPSVNQVVERVRAVRREWEAAEAADDRGEFKETNANARGYDSETNTTSPPPRKLTHIHIMTNAEPGYLTSLLSSLNPNSPSDPAGGGDTWVRITCGSDLSLTPEQSFIGQAIDMAIGERAGVFIGNGFSSLSANVVMLRMARGQPMGSNRFW